MFVLLCFAVHYTPDLSNNLFGSVRGKDGNVGFQFQGQASLFNEGSTPERNALIMGGDEHTFRIIITTASLEGGDQTIYRKPDFIFRDATPDTD